MQQQQDSTAALLIIGAEVLAGKVEDENGPFLIRALRERGVRVLEIRVLDDVQSTISLAIQELSPRVTWVFTTGGIGPTHDDVTLAAVADAFERPLIAHPELISRLENHYGDDLTPERLRMANVPESAGIRFGPQGLLPLIQVDNVVVLPGVPSLMRICFERLSNEIRGAQIFTRAIFLNRSESALSAHLRQVQRNMPEVAIGSYPRFDPDSDYRVKVTVDGRDAAAVDAALGAIKEGFDPEWIIRELGDE